MVNRSNRAAALMLCFLLSQQALAEIKQAPAGASGERAAALTRYHDWLVKKHDRVEYVDANNKPISKEAFMRGALVEQRNYDIGVKYSTAASSVARFELRPDKPVGPAHTVIPPSNGALWKPTREELNTWHDDIARRCALIEYADAQRKPMGKEAFLTALTRGQAGVTMTQRGDPDCGRMQLGLLAMNATPAPAQPSKK